jgi:predicted AlkP superfamily pyrophosphatase or phosphodiesterase
MIFRRLHNCAIFAFTAALVCLAVLHSASAAVRGVKYVVIIGCDGMSPAGVQKAEAPNMRRLMAEGAWTMHARGVIPTVSSPNWASMIMGAGPAQHGVTSNEWEPNKFEIAPIAVGSGGIFPTIFGALREQRPGAVIACFHDWDGFGRLFERKAADVIENPKGPTNTIERAVACFKERKPTFTFIHLDHVDHAGHEIGWGTPEYIEAVGVADKLIGEAVQGLRDAGMWDKTILLVTADHGGKGKHHGGSTMEEIEIPWMLHGPGVARGRELATPVNTYDTAVTVAYIFGLKPPDCWIGRPVKEAFSK